MKHLVYLLTLLLFIASCGTQDICDDDSQSLLVARFKTLEDDAIADTTMEAISIYGIREGKADSLLYDSQSMSRVELPLDPNQNFSHFVLSNDISQDTLQITYSSEAYLISYTCGFAARFTLDQFTNSGSWISDMVLIEGEIDAELESNEEHLWIYF
jgi:hypothetical protein